MYKLLCPQAIVNSLYEIEIEKMKNTGIKGIIFDLDNTIIAWDSVTIQLKVSEWLAGVQASGLKVAVVSNGLEERVSNIAGQLGIPYIAKAYKPTNRGFCWALAAMELTKTEVAVVGDQLFTDILGGNRLGLYTIWVKPLSANEFIGTKITRKVERITVRILRAKGLWINHMNVFL